MPSSLHVGVLLLPAFQLLDMSPVDLFGMTWKEYLSVCELPSSMVALGHDTVTTSYISPIPKATLAESTASAAVRVNYSDLAAPEIAPGKLDVLLIPGPEPSFVPDEPTKAFIKAHAAEGANTTIMTICTGIFAAGHAGILEGKSVTGPRLLVSRLEKLFPKANFVDRRWSVDGNLWTSGGVTNGQDMVAAFLRHKWPGPMSDMVCVLADVGERGQDYGSYKASDTLWVVWLLLKSFFAGKVKVKET